MLVLTRGLNEDLVIDTPEGRRIVVTICGVQGLRVRVGVDADRDVRVRRQEIAERKAG